MLIQYNQLKQELLVDFSLYQIKIYKSNDFNIFDINSEFALFSILEKRNIKIMTLIKNCNLIKKSVLQYLG